jgi:hypothetical protein
MHRVAAALFFAMCFDAVAGGWTLSSETKLAALPGGAEFIEREALQGDRAVRVQGVFFHEKTHALRVIDNPPPVRGVLQDAMAREGCIAGVNGGYFHPDFTPVGLVIANGEPVHAFERAKLLSGVLAVSGTSPGLWRSSEFKPSKSIRQALQGGPFLVDGGTAVAGLDDTKRARRTVIAADGKGGWAILQLSHCTLTDAANILASTEIFPSWPIQRALNLDGGSSSALWVQMEPKSFYLSETGSVRNYLGVTAR